MLKSFRLKRPIGPDSSMDLDDVLATKRALRDLGHFRMPKYGLTPYPDEPMIAGVKSFQRENGLREDGVMKPDGPTITALGQALEQRRRQRPALGIVEGEWDWMRGPHRRRGPFPDPVFTTILLPRSRRPSIFDVLGDVGRDRQNRSRDVLALRRALAWAGHLPRHRAVDTTDADDELFGAVERFQKAARLKTDGLVGLGGETARALNGAIATKVKAHLQETADDAPDEATSEKASPQLAMARKPRPSGSTGGTEGATMLPPFLGGGAAAIGTSIVAQELLRQSQEKKGKGEVPPPPEAGAARPRTDIAPSVPPTPGLEPPDDHDRLPQKTESPVQTVEIPDLSKPLPKVDKPTIFVHPLPPEKLRGGMIIERKGNEATRNELERIRDFFRRKGWEHIAGGRYAPDDPEVLDPSKPEIEAGTERKERHIPGPGKAFKTDTRPGGHFTDLTFRDDRGRVVHIQSVDVDRNGKPTQRELDIAERIRRAEKDTDVFLIPKGAQLERNQRFRRRT